MLTQEERDIIIKLLEEGKDIPSMYKEKMFTTELARVDLTKEYKLQYYGKESKASIISNTIAAPLQKVRVFNEENKYDDGWVNKLIFGDNLNALKTIYDDLKPGGPNRMGLKNRIKLIYIDPPFATKQDFMKDKEKAYRDKIVGSEFIEFLRKRLVLLREILADNGSIYVHLDWKKGHYIKAIIDEIFGEENFKNEIIFKCTPGHNLSSGMDNMISNIYYYTKGDKYIFNSVYEELSEKELLNKFPLIEKGTNRRFTHEKLEKASNSYSAGEERVIQGRRIISDIGWIWTQQTFDNRLAQNPNLIFWTENGRPRYKRYLDEYEGRKVSNLWNNLKLLASNSKESYSYPTQKPESLLERIIEISTNKGDIVLDAFAGSGTTVATAEKLGRKWIGIDCGKLSIYTIQKRMLNLNTRIGSEKKDNRDIFDRIIKREEVVKDKLILGIGEKVRKGELEVTEEFLRKCSNFLKDITSIKKVALMVPKKKIKLSNIEINEGIDNIVNIIVDGIEYNISLINEKEKSEKAQKLNAKNFELINSGVYYEDEILKLDWNEYKEFVMKLFQVRDYGHEISGFKVHGYLGVSSVYIWNYPDKKDVKLDKEYINTLHQYMGGKAGERFYIIAPVSSLNFMEDEYKIDKTIYHILKVPVSVIIRLLKSGQIGAYSQPKNENDINNIIDSVGFDFITQPIVNYSLLKDSEKYKIKINEFKSQGLYYDEEDFENFETLSMILVDVNYSNDFILDKVIWKDEVNINAGIELIIDNKELENEGIAIILIDIYGNEKKLVFREEDF